METKAREFLESAKFVLFVGAVVTCASWAGFIWGVVAIVKLF